MYNLQRSDWLSVQREQTLAIQYNYIFGGRNSSRFIFWDYSKCLKSEKINKKQFAQSLSQTRIYCMYEMSRSVFKKLSTF